MKFFVYIEKIKNYQINAGTLYLSQLYVPIIVDYVNCQNGVKIPLHDILIYAATDDGIFDYVMYSSLKQDGKKTMKSSLLKLECIIKWTKNIK